MPRRLLVSLVVALVAAPLVAQSPGPLVLVGGGAQPDALVDEFVRLAGGPGRARIVVFAMASAAGERSGEAKAADLRARGAQATAHWLTRAQALTDSAARLLDSATGIWFGGGDQSRLMAVLGGTPVARAIRARHAAGAVVGGTSAGAAVLSAVMITGEERRGAANADTTQDWTTIARETVGTAEGLGLLEAAIVDQHFVRRRRQNRLLSLVLERAPHLGVGVDEGTALIVEPDGRWRVAGTSAVVIIDARRAARTAATQRLGGAGLALHVLPAGARFTPMTGEVVLP